MRATGDAVAVVGIAGYAYREYLHVDWPVVESETQLRELMTSQRRTWLVYAMPELIEARTPELWRTIQQSFRERAAFPGTLAGGVIVVRVNE